ncbi:hypothetical protein P7C71_g5776, partial [Lecanoromycetidae sp. Uapishka_2]
MYIDRRNTRSAGVVGHYTYQQRIGDYQTYMQNATSDLWDPANPAGVGATVVQNTMKGGSWTNIGDPLAVPDLQNNMNVFFEGLLGSSVINEVMKNNGWWITFVPFGTVTDWLRHPDSTPGTVQFTADDCNNHWANDPKRPNYISCSLTYGTTAGMTILTEPAITDSYGNLQSGGGTLSLAQAAAFSDPQNAFTFNLDDAIQGSLNANSMYGFNYNYTTDQLQGDVTSGAVKLTGEFQGLPQSTPGLYNLDVCVMTELSMIPGANQYIISNNIWEYFYLNPCICANFTSHGQTFSKVATPAAINATTTDANGLVCTSLLSDLDGLASDGE